MVADAVSIDLIMSGHGRLVAVIHHHALAKIVLVLTSLVGFNYYSCTSRRYWQQPRARGARGSGRP